MNTRINRAPTIYPSRKKEKKRFFTIKKVIFFICILALFYLALFLIVVPERPNKPFFKGEKPLVIAHRGGSNISPENTLIAFEKARSLGVDVIEFDIHMSKDGHLVVIHDAEVDRTTDGTGRVDELTLAELRELDAAYHFRDIRGRNIYRGQGVTIPTVEEVFQEYGDMRLNIEIKDAYPLGEELESEIEAKLWDLIQKYELQDQVLVVSFSEKIMKRFSELSQGSVALGAPSEEVQRFVFYHKLFLNRLYRPQSDVFQIPTHAGLFSLDDQRLIQGAHHLNMKVHFWTINQEQEMRNLLKRGVDGIMTDRPDLLIRVMNEMEEFRE